jgi:hypothetical protein
MQVSGAGAGIGALVGAAGRALVVFCWLGPNAGIFALPSAGIGILVGAIAGSLGKPLRGALVGFFLSAFVFELFMFACASALGNVTRIFGAKDAEATFLTEALPYALLMGVAGAAAGGIGGAVGSASRKNGPLGVKPELSQGEPAEPDAATDRPRDERFFER